MYLSYGIEDRWNNGQRVCQGVTKRCRLSLLTNRTLVIQVQRRGEGGSCGVSANEYSCAHHVTWRPNKLRRSSYIFNLWSMHLSGSDHLCSLVTSNKPCTVKVPHIAKTQNRTFETNIPRTGTAWLQSQLMLMWAIYVFLWPVCLFCCWKIGGPRVGIYRSLTDTWIQFLFWEYLNSNFHAVQFQMSGETSSTCSSLVWAREFCCWENTIIDDFKRAGGIPREVCKSSSGELEYT